MITSSKFAKSHVSFWQSCFPALEGYVRLVNSGAYERIFDPMIWTVEPHRSSLVSEVAFCFASAGTKANIDKAYEAARKRLSGLPGIEDDGIVLGREEMTLVEELAHRTNIMVDSLKETKAPKVFDPLFAGYGAMEAAYGDIMAGGTLFELKAVDRGFRGTDFRQLMTYCLLNSYEKGSTIDAIALINARRGIFHFAKLNDFVFDASACTFQDIQLRFASAVGMGGTSR